MKLLIIIFSLSIFLSKSSENSEDTGLRKWLEKLVVNVPTVSFKRDLIGNITLSNLVIDSILLGGLQSETLYNKTEKTGISLSISNIGFHVFGNYKITETLLGGEGTIEIKAINVDCILNISH